MTINEIKNIDDAKKILSQKNITGIGVTAFNLILISMINDNFEIICYKDSLDIELIKKHGNIHILKKTINKTNTQNIIQAEEIQEYINKRDGIYICRNTEEIEKICTKKGIHLINNSYTIADKYENKKEFRNILEKIGIQKILGENIGYKAFTNKEYEHRKTKYGRKIVIQLPDIKKGGGNGTYFINNKNEFKKVKEKIIGGSYTSVNITRFIQGISCSISCCTTKFGTLTSSLQTQILDIPEVIRKEKGNGLFCGHDRSTKHFPKTIQKKAEKIAEKIGEKMYTEGYKGIFGLDLIIEKNSIHVVECNPRITGAFPMTSMIDLENKKIPMDVFNILELMNIDYNINFEKINKSYKYKKEGSHIILSNKENNDIYCTKDVKAGVYTYKDKTVKYIRKGITYKDIKNKHEFIIIDGNPRKGQKINTAEKGGRFCRLLFSNKIIGKDNKLLPGIKTIINKIYTTYLTV